MLVGTALLGILGVVAYFTWRSIEEGQRIGTWTYSQLLTEAQRGDVVTVVIDGQTGMATDRSGREYFVTLPADTTATAKELTADGVNVTFRQQRDALYWLQVLIPNLILLLLVGAVPSWRYSRGWGYGPSGILGVILVVVLILALTGRV